MGFFPRTKVDKPVVDGCLEKFLPKSLSELTELRPPAPTLANNHEICKNHLDTAWNRRFSGPLQAERVGIITRWLRCEIYRVSQLRNFDGTKEPKRPSSDG